MDTSWYRLVLGILAVWRVSHLLAAESGPWDVFGRLRRLAGGGFWGSLLGCFYCLSLWIAAPFAFALAEQWTERVLLWLAFSAAAILLERITSRDGEIPAAIYAEDEERTNVLR
jgi:hypothetical protein